MPRNVKILHGGECSSTSGVMYSTASYISVCTVFVPSVRYERGSHVLERTPVPTWSSEPRLLNVEVAHPCVNICRTPKCHLHIKNGLRTIA